MADSLDVREFIAGYLAEAEENITAAHANVMAVDEALRRGTSNPRAVRELFRALHTLKGLSAMIGAEPIVDLSHEMETVLRAADRAGGLLPSEALDMLAEGLRAVEERVAALAKGAPVKPAPQELLARLASLRVEPAAAPSGERLSLHPSLFEKLSLAEQEQLRLGLHQGMRALRIDFSPSPEKAERAITISTVRERVSRLGDLVKVVPRWVPASDRAPGGLAFSLLLLTQSADEAIADAAFTSPSELEPITLSSGPPSAQPAPATDESLLEQAGVVARHGFVRVDVNRLDQALDRLSALVVTRGRLEREVGALQRGEGDVRALAAVVAESGRQLRDLRQAVMEARLVRVAELLDRTPLLVRGLAQASGKRVRLEIDAGTAELDKAVGERLMPALVHLLRNAVDHAIEPPSERVQNGKPEEGRIRIACRELSNSELELTLSDDGRGIDRAEVAARAGVAVPPDDSGLLELLARPGLSTLAEATRTSGRGMGMNIVLRTVEDLGGDLRVHTAAGKGTAFELRVPLSVTIIEAFSFECGHERFVVPVNAVDELADGTEGIGGPGTEQPVRLLRHRGEVIPLLELGALLNLRMAPVARPKVLIVRRDTAGVVGFQVDRMVGRQEVVVRPLADPLVAVPAIAGATDLGDGRPTLVLDLAALLRGAPRPSLEVLR